MHEEEASREARVGTFDYAKHHHKVVVAVVHCSRWKA